MKNEILYKKIEDLKAEINNSENLILSYKREIISNHVKCADYVDNGVYIIEGGAGYYYYTSRCKKETLRNQNGDWIVRVQLRRVENGFSAHKRHPKYLDRNTSTNNPKSLIGMWDEQSKTIIRGWEDYPISVKPESLEDGVVLCKRFHGAQDGMFIQLTKDVQGLLLNKDSNYAHIVVLGRLEFKDIKDTVIRATDKYMLEPKGTNDE